MNREQILEALRALARLLNTRGIQGEMFLVGGAAIAVAYNARRATRDVDAIFEPKQAIYEAARIVAEEMGLSESWLNDAVKLFLRTSDPAPIPVLDEPGLRVLAASPRYLLALKLLAARREDEADIRFLIEQLGIRQVNEAIDTVLSVYPEAQLLPKTRFMLEEILGAAPDSAGEE